MDLSKSLKLAMLLVIVLSTLSLAHKPKPLTAVQLRENYVAALMSYEGDGYAPYGENGGISCSTLVRDALIDTIGIDQVTRSTVQHDPCSSDDLRKGCDGELTPILRAANLKSIDYSQLQTGDIAVVGNRVGVHTMAYIGNETWIHADPISEKVVETDEPDENDDWLTFQVTVMRWNILSDN